MIDPTDPEHADVVAAFLADHPEHAPYLQPVRRLVVRGPEGDWQELTPELLAELLDAALILDDQLTQYRPELEAVKKWNRKRNIANDPEPRREPRKPVAPGHPAWAELVSRTDYRWSAATLLEKVARMNTEHDDPLSRELCPHPGCDEHVPMGRTYMGITRPRFAPRNWHSVVPWDTFALCGPTHLSTFGKRRAAAFKAVAAWLPAGAARLAAERADALALVDELRTELVAAHAGLERLATQLTGIDQHDPEHEGVSFT